MKDFEFYFIFLSFFFLQIENVSRSFNLIEFYGIVEFYGYYILR